MLYQLPGFTVRSATDARGLGQASENVLINGQRVTDKSGGAVERLRNVPAGDVERIEISEAAALGIAGLTGEVANFVLKEDRKASGRWEWGPRVRPLYAAPAWLRGSISYTGSLGKLDYTLSVRNFGNRGAIGGPDYLVLAPGGGLLEQRDQVQRYLYDNAKLSALLKYGADGPVQANLNLSYEPYWERSLNSQRRDLAGGEDNDWLTTSRSPGHKSEVSGDLSLPLLAGTIKLVGLRRQQQSSGITIQTAEFDSGAATTGVLFGRDAHTDEIIGRAEYHRKIGKNDWELSLERAFNRLDQTGSLAELQPDGAFQDIPFPQGSGIVEEVRYEAVLSLSRPLGAKLDLQVVGGGEISHLRHADRDEPARKFFRPKGSVSLAWRPAADWDASLKLERRVGQISFYDFLAQPDLVLDRENAANPDLVPPQSWELTGEVGRNFGAWGKTRLRVYAHRIDDIVDFIPIGDTGEAVGNLDRATRLGFESKSTIQFDPIGWTGAKVDITFGAEHTRVRDPLTGQDRPISSTRDRWANVSLRHDIPKSQIAWGASFSLDHFGWAYYLGEVNRNWEGPYFGVFLQHKDIHGIKATLDVFNVTDARNHFDRLVYGGRRNVAPLVFKERQNQRVSQIITLTLTGAF
jgi:outer membrane receptor for ferrienterochelin and colicins